MIPAPPTVSDKRMTLGEVVAELHDGMTIGIGGWAARRKPMAFVRAITRSKLRDLTIVSYGGPDVGLLCAVGKVRRVVFGFVSLDSIPYDPLFRRARESGEVTATELDEGMLRCGLLAAAQRLPFLPIRAGLGSDIPLLNGTLRTVRSPYDGPAGAPPEELIAMPPLHLDAALVHLNEADPHGNARYLGPDPYFDDLFCLAARRRFLSVERVVDTAELAASGPPQAMLLNRMMVDGVVEAPRGAHFTSCVPDYGRDEPFQRHYAAAGADPATFAEFAAAFLAGDETAYQAAVRDWRGDNDHAP